MTEREIAEVLADLPCNACGQQGKVAAIALSDVPWTIVHVAYPTTPHAWHVTEGQIVRAILERVVARWDKAHAEFVEHLIEERDADLADLEARIARLVESVRGDLYLHEIGELDNQRMIAAVRAALTAASSSPRSVHSEGQAPEQG